MTPTAAAKTSFFRFTYASWQLFICILLLTIPFLSQASAQATNPTQGFTPSGLKPGAPAGSYGLSGFDNINLYNGNLNFRLPLLGIGGRGGAKMQMMIAIDSVRWTVDKDSGADWESFTPNPNWWGGLRPGYGPGVLQGRQPVVRALFGQGKLTNTRLTFIASDGTEYELRDKLKNGQAGSVSVRGKIFVSTDGSSMTFISDTTIQDSTEDDSGYIYPVGYLFMSDGTRYRIGELNGSKGGLVTKIRDNNGNELSFTYDDDNRVSTITDSLNRQVNITYGLVDPLKPRHTYDTIIYKGVGGTSRAIKIWRTNLGRALRSDLSGVMNYYDLFPGLSGSPYTNYDPTDLASSVELPDGRTYELRYNQWGNLARVVLPTGGAIEYDYANNVTSEYINRPVTVRRVYSDGTTNTLDGKQVYSQTFTTSPEDQTQTTVKQYAADETTILAHSKHYFKGAPGPSQGVGLNSYSKWDQGREYKTETLSTSETGTPVLRRVEQTWAQSPDTGLLVWWANGLSNGPSMNPRVVETVTTLMDSSPYKVSKQTVINPVTLAVGFDQYNNQTDAWETDYVNEGSSWVWLRHSHTDYLTTNDVNGKSYNTMAGTDSVPDIANTIHIRRLPKEQVVYSVNPATGADSSSAAAHTKYYYDQWTLTPRSNISGLDANFTASYAPRGNLTRNSSWLNDTTAGTWINTDVKYDVAGNVVESIDARNNSTLFNYEDRFGATNGDVNSYSVPLELSTPTPAQSSYAFVTSVSNALGHTSHAKYDFYLGVPVDGQDVNGVVASGYYTNAQQQTDPLDRPFKMVTAVGTSVQSQSSFSYNDAARMVTVTSDRDAYNDNLLKTETFYDKLGRTTETRAYESATAYITSKQEYDALGRVKRSYNPYRTTSDPTYGWTETNYDALGRFTTVKTSDNALISTVYDNNKVMTTDQAGRARRTITDALGRLTQVVEDPNGLSYPTNYTYDVLGNLRKVEQGQTGQGAQYRYFMYDSLSRLLYAWNPEQGVIPNLTVTGDALVDGNSQWSLKYTYDVNGNLDIRTDARNIETNYDYDVLNRNTTVTYSQNANTPNITNRYDHATLAYAKGRLWQTETTGDEGTLATINSFDALGRALSQSQQFKTGGAWSAAYTSQQTYRITGSVNTKTYPSGHTTSYGYDTAGRLSSFTGNLGDGVSRTYSSNIAYDEGGRMLEEQYGTQTALYHKQRYNIRGQLYDVRLSTLSRAQSANDWDRGCLAFYYNSDTHGGSSVTNNGNLTKAESYIPNSDGSYNMLQDRYDYDSLNRLQSVSEYQWGTQSVFTQAYSYDRFGNRQINSAASTSNVNTTQFAINTSNNRLGVPSGQPGQMLYDAAGNLTTDTYSRGDTRTYDGESRLITNTDSVSALSRYTYDSSGKRVRRTISSQQTWQVYGIGGEMVAEYAANASPSSVQKEYGYRGGELLVTATSTAEVQWLISDHLGTPRMIADHTGSLSGVKRHDYLPFGEEIFAGTGGRTSLQGYAADNVRQKFTKYERDSETGLDFAQARYYSNAQGRFTSIDAAGPELANPQTLNKYRYALNNPLRFVDKNGLYEKDVHELLTRALAIGAGFEVSAATRIAAANQGTDDSPDTGPFTSRKARELWHFTTEKRRQELESGVNDRISKPSLFNGYSTGNTLDLLGMYLHTVQDSFSHEGFGPKAGQLWPPWTGSTPDKTYNDPAKADRMAKATFDALVKAASKFAKAQSGLQIGKPVAWEKIEPYVQAFNRAKTDEDKAKAIDGLLQYVLGEYNKQFYTSEQWRGCFPWRIPRWASPV